MLAFSHPVLPRDYCCKCFFVLLTMLAFRTPRGTSCACTFARLLLQALSMSKVKYFASFIEFVCGAQYLEFGAAVQPVALLALLVVIEGIDKLLGQRVALF